MRIVATLTGRVSKAEKLLNKVPLGSVVLLPEAVEISSQYVRKVSRDRKLFIIFNEDAIENDKHYITMKAYDSGEYQWRVRKFKLWGDDFKYYSASRSEPIVNIRGKVASVFICNDLTTIGRNNYLFPMGEVIKKYKTEILCMPSNWLFNFDLVENTLETAFNKIPTLKAGLFSCTHKLALAYTRREKIRLDDWGWESVEI